MKSGRKRCFSMEMLDWEVIRWDLHRMAGCKMHCFRISPRSSEISFCLQKALELQRPLSHSLNGLSASTTKALEARWWMMWGYMACFWAPTSGLRQVKKGMKNHLWPQQRLVTKSCCPCSPDFVKSGNQMGGLRPRSWTWSQGLTKTAYRGYAARPDGLEQGSQSGSQRFCAPWTKRLEKSDHSTEVINVPGGKTWVSSQCMIIAVSDKGEHFLKNNLIPTDRLLMVKDVMVSRATWFFIHQPIKRHHHTLYPVERRLSAFCPGETNC